MKYSLLPLCCSAIILCACEDDVTSAPEADQKAEHSVDTLVIYNNDTTTIYSKDTLVLKQIDTLVIKTVDTLTNIDTVILYDTIVNNTTVNFEHYCDSVPYDPTEIFCLNGKTYSCNGKAYNPDSFYCNDDKITEKPLCRYDYYNPQEEICDKRDGNIYKFVTIGEQTWMAENLRLTKLSFGDFFESETTDSLSYCLFNDPAYCEKYGRLYSWSVAIDSLGEFSSAGKGCGYGNLCNLGEKHRGICPEDWHLPSLEEWNQLFEFIGDSAAYKLRAKTGWFNPKDDFLGKDYEPINGSDAYGFNLLPASTRWGDTGESDFDGNVTAFWTTTENDNGVFVTTMIFHPDTLTHFNFKSTAISVRCVKN